MEVTLPPIFRKQLGTKRAKRRYILIQLIFYSGKGAKEFEKNPKFDTRYMYDALFQHFGNVWGRMLLGFLSALRPHKIVYMNKQTRIIIISIPRDLQKYITSSLPLVKNLKEIECSCRIYGISGTIVNIKKKAIEYHLKTLRELGKEVDRNHISVHEILDVTIDDMEERQ